MNFKLKTPNTRTNSLILFYVTLSGGKRFVYSTGQKIPVRLWDKHSQFPKRTKSQNDQVITNSVNIRLESLKTAYLNLNFQYKSSGRILTKEILKQEFDILFKGVSKKTAPNDFDSCFEDFFKFKLKEGGWSNATAKRYRTLYKLVKEFEKIDDKIEIELIDVFWITDFKKYCQEIKSHQVNTLGRNIGLLKTFLNYCLKNDFITNSSFKEVAVNREITNQLALSKEEIQQIADLDLSNRQRLERVRDVFLLGCYTGMRYSDFKRVRASNVTNNLITIREVKDKTKTLEIPMTDKIRAILNKYNLELPVISEQKFREYLKEIFKIAGFTSLVVKSKKIGKNVYEEEVPKYQLISTHTARRSFITIMLNSGVPAKAIMNITGHKSINNFQLYYKPTNDVLSDFMQKVWK
jgi:site-specific recombinase XerD